MMKKTYKSVRMSLGVLMGAMMTVACSSNEDIVTERARVQASLNMEFPKVEDASTRTNEQVKTIRLKPIEGEGPTLVVTVGKPENGMATRAFGYNFSANKRQSIVWDWLENVDENNNGAFVSNVTDPAPKNSASSISVNGDHTILNFSHYEPGYGQRYKAVAYAAVVPKECDLQITHGMPTSENATFTVTMPDKGYSSTASQAPERRPLFVKYMKYGWDSEKDTPSYTTIKESSVLKFYTVNFSLSPSEALRQKLGYIQQVKISDCYRKMIATYDSNDGQFGETYEPAALGDGTTGFHPTMNLPPANENETIEASMTVMRDKLLGKGTLKLIFSNTNGQGKHATVTYDLTHLQDNYEDEVLYHILNFTLSND